jgi:hypothetical protein
MAVPGRDPGISPGHPAFRPDGPHPEEPLQAASRRRSSALFRTLLRDAASRLLLRMRASETIGITARDTLCPHGRACAGHPDPVRLGASRIGITGTSPVMTAEGAVGGCEGRTYPPIHAVSLTALILRSRAAASRRRLRRAPEARCPARRFAPQVRPNLRLSSPSWPGLSRPSRSDERRVSLHRDHRHRSPDQVRGGNDGEITFAPSRPRSCAAPRPECPCRREPRRSGRRWAPAVGRRRSGKEWRPSRCQNNARPQVPRPRGPW